MSAGTPSSRRPSRQVVLLARRQGRQATHHARNGEADHGELGQKGPEGLGAFPHRRPWDSCYFNKYRRPSCICQRDKRLGSSMKVVAGPVMLNTGAPVTLSNRTRLSGDVAAGLATFRTPQDEFIRFPTFRISTLNSN